MYPVASMRSGKNTGLCRPRTTASTVPNTATPIDAKNRIRTFSHRPSRMSGKVEAATPGSKNDRWTAAHPGVFTTPKYTTARTTSVDTTDTAIDRRPRCRRWMRRSSSI